MAAKSKATSVTVLTAGRTDDIPEMLRRTGLMEDRRWPHTPFLAFVVTDRTVTVQLITSPAQLRALDPATPLMVQWRGQWSSDFFQLTAEQAQAALAESEAKYPGLHGRRGR